MLSKKMAGSPNEMEEKIMTEQEKLEELVDVFEMDLMNLIKTHCWKIWRHGTLLPYFHLLP